MYMYSSNLYQEFSSGSEEQNAHGEETRCEPAARRFPGCGLSVTALLTQGAEIKM